MVWIIGGIVVFYMFMIGFVFDKNKCDDFVWVLIFENFVLLVGWFVDKCFDVLLFIYNDYVMLFFFDYYLVFLFGVGL